MASAQGPSGAMFRFGIFEFYPSTGELFKSGTRIFIRPQPAQLLALLLERAPDLVTRDHIREALWDGETNVDFELGINRCVRQLRSALSDDAEQSRFVERVPRRGYRFIGPLAPAGHTVDRTTAAGDGQLCIAVLPFVNLSGNPDDEYFSDGLSEEITNALVQAAFLKVIARTSAFAFKGHTTDIRTIAARVGATMVLEGSVRRSGNRLRITAQLIRASDGTHLLSKRYDRDTVDIFAVQDEISADVALTLRVHLTPLRHATTNLKAYEALLEGRFHWHKYTPAGFKAAYRCFERAAAMDPSFSSAYTGMAEYFLAMVMDGGAPATEFLPKSLIAARRAIDCNPDDAEAHTALALTAAILEFDWAEAESRFRRARELRAGPLTGVGYVLWFLLPQGRCEEAVLECERVIQRDPLLLLARTTKATTLLLSRDYGGAEKACMEALTIDPEFAKAWQTLTYVCGLQGRIADGVACAEKLLQLLGPSHASFFTLGLAHGAAGDREKAYEALRRMDALPGGGRGGPTGIACVHALLGEADLALHWMKQAIDNRDPRVLWMKTHPWADSLRNDSRYTALIREMRLTTAPQVSTISSR